MKVVTSKWMSFQISSNIKLIICPKPIRKNTSNSRKENQKRILQHENPKSISPVDWSTAMVLHRLVIFVALEKEMPKF